MKAAEILELLTPCIDQKMTFFKFSDFGFPSLLHCKLLSVKIGSYAQYNDVLTIVYVQKGKRKPYQFRVLPHSELLVWKGHEPVNSEVYIKTITDEPGLKVRQSDMGFSKNYFTTALASVPVEPLIKILG